MAKLTLSLGSNVGDRSGLLAQARAAIGHSIGPLVYQSEVLVTPAWGMTDQGDFLNQIVVVIVPKPGRDSRAYLHDLLDRTQAIEWELGRERKLHWGPRTIDIDLIFVADIRYEDERISLPHPWWNKRNLVTDLLPGGLAHDGYFGIRDGGE